jgi:hypothetical protein
MDNFNYLMDKWTFPWTFSDNFHLRGHMDIFVDIFVDIFMDMFMDKFVDMYMDIRPAVPWQPEDNHYHQAAGLAPWWGRLLDVLIDR